ncbi:MAG: 4Fe-4S binding protein [Candidatus Micrarchaeota archaeon]
MDSTDSNAGGKVFKLDKSKCIYCAGCAAVCPASCIMLNETRIECDEAKCIKCQVCEKVCPVKAIKIVK